MGQSFNKGLMDALLHVEAIGCRACLAAVPHFCDHRAVESCIEVGVVEDDEWRIATQLHRTRNDRIGSLAKQPAANFG